MYICILYTIILIYNRWRTKAEMDSISMIPWLILFLHFWSSIMKNMEQIMRKENFIIIDSGRFLGEHENVWYKSYTHFMKHDFAKNVTAIDGAREMIERLHNDWHENYIVTSRPEYTQNQTQAIVENIFGEHIKDIYFANHYAHHGAPKKKSEICAYLWLSSMTEDSLEYAEDCAQVSSTILLWNQQGSYHSTRIQRVRNHQEVLKILR